MPTDAQLFGGSGANLVNGAVGLGNVGIGLLTGNYGQAISGAVGAAGSLPQGITSLADLESQLESLGQAIGSYSVMGLPVPQGLQEMMSSLAASYNQASNSGISAGNQAWLNNPNAPSFQVGESQPGNITNEPAAGSGPLGGQLSPPSGGSSGGGDGGGGGGSGDGGRAGGSSGGGGLGIPGSQAGGDYPITGGRQPINGPQYISSGGFGASFGGSGSSGGGSTVGSNLSGLAQQYQDAYNSAKNANEQRYQQINQGYTDLYNRSMAMTDTMGQTQAAEIARNYSGLRSQQGQDLVSRGLAGTTIKPTVEQGTRRDEQFAQNQLAENVNQQKVGLQNQLLGNQLNFQERRTDAYPDAQLYANLMQQAAAGGYGTTPTQSTPLASTQPMTPTQYTWVPGQGYQPYYGGAMGPQSRPGW